MGPITGFRIVNLRAQAKVAYPDLTVNLDNRAHTVVGQENGGGKSTLIGFLIHVLLPNATEFLPRKAKRRQEKKGEDKRVENYVPGGPPTHVVLEFDLPHRGTITSTTPTRVLVGACLYKPDGAGPTVKAEEFFWSARCASPELTLPTLPLRDDDGGLLSHQRWRHHLNVLKEQLPAAEIVIHGDQRRWEAHLKDDLKIDVGFARSWLLTMNEDEGAADRVFTYASSREFLNSLVGAIADPTSLSDIKATLRMQAADADRCRLDRRRKKLLELLVTQTDPLADLSAQLTAIDTSRRDLISGVLSARRSLTKSAAIAKGRAETAQGQKRRADEEERAAAHIQAEARGLEIAARLQVADLTLKETIRQVEDVNKSIAAQEKISLVCGVAGHLAERASLRTRMSDAVRILADKSADAEPARRAASSAASAWVASLEAELETLAQAQTGQKTVLAKARAALHDAAGRRTTADRRITTLQAYIEGEQKALHRLDQLLEKARKDGLVGHDQLPAEALTSRKEEHDRLDGDLTTAEEQLEGLQERLQSLNKQAAALQGKLGVAAAATEQAHRRWQQAKDTTNKLIDDIAGSGLLDLEVINLDDSAPLVLDLLNAVMDSAHKRILTAAVDAAAATRAAKALHDTRLMPPRPDIERVCKEAAKAGWGARPGWAYLALTPAAAIGAATRHPALADGIIVNVPEDLQQLIDYVQSQRDTLTGPVCIGPPSAFAFPGNEDVTVVLPHESYWSTDAADRRLDRCERDEQIQHSAIQAQTQRQRTAQALHNSVTEWTAMLGPGAVDAAEEEHSTREAELAELTRDKTTLEAQIEEIRQNVKDTSSLTTQLRTQLTDLKLTVERLTLLKEQWAQRPASEERVRGWERDLDAVTQDLETAQHDHGAAEADQQAATDAINQIVITVGGLNKELAKARLCVAEIARLGDEISPDDRAASRETLAVLTEQRSQHYRGAISDAHLEAEISHCRQRIDPIESALAERAPERSDLRVKADELLRERPTAMPADFAQKADTARARVGELKESRGELRHQQATQQKTLEAIRSEADKVPKVTLTDEDSTADLAEAETIVQRRQAVLAEAEKVHGRAERARSDASRQADRAIAIHDLVTTTRDRIYGSLVSLSAPGLLLPSIDLETADFDTKDLDLDSLPAPLTRFLALLTSTDDHTSEEFTAAADQAVDDLTGLIDLLSARRSTTESSTNRQLETVEVVLRGADEEIRSGDQMLQTLYSMPRTTLIQQAVTINNDATQRLALLAHRLANFDGQVANTARTTFAHLSHIVTAVRQTARDSLLPTTPALGRWGNTPLLKFGGLDMSKADQQAHILATMQEWFDPDRTDRPSFDADTTIYKLLEAMTPRFSARLLIPSDPLDPDHKPVEKIALNTSGGEGVTIALILASLLAARRAKDNGHQHSTLILDNPFSKVTKPMFLRLVRDVASSLGVRLISFTGIRDSGALTVFPSFIGLRVSRRHTANIVAPQHIDDDDLQTLLRNGTLYVSPIERDAATGGGDHLWPVISAAAITYDTQLQLSDLDEPLTGDDPGDVPS
ncbi:hypothetical protein ABZT47_28655 [Sphaerisporangium sp. NPDC005289]|uniref:hypothetical protein n=1 Tax=Sphaerisporangium sp. NPDC005289 TaxID=3155247 RepID=UPI0033AC1967